MVQAEYVIGLDVGTTSAKAVVFDTALRLVATGRAPTPWQGVDSGAETSAIALRDAALCALSEAVGNTPAGPIRGVGVASLGESGVLLDATHEPIAPVIAWYDRRDVRELDELDRLIGADEFRTRTGLPFRQQWSLTKQRWLERHHPGMSGVRLRLNVAEWIALSLGAPPAAELSLASRTGLLDVTTASWWGETTEFAGLPPAALPDLVRCGDVLGRVTNAALPSRLQGAAITIAGHDHQAGAVGLGATSAGDVVDSSGTAEALVRTADPLASRSGIRALASGGVTVGWHALPGYWCLLGATEGGLLLGRVLSLLGLGSLTPQLDAAARDAAVSTIDVRQDDRGHLVIAGIGADASPAQLWRAATAAITEQARKLHDMMSAHAGAHGAFIVTGGWTASKTLLDRKRERFGPLRIPSLGEAGARGGALFAGVAAGLWPSVRSKVEVLPEEQAQ